METNKPFQKWHKEAEEIADKVVDLFKRNHVSPSMALYVITVLSAILRVNSKSQVLDDND